jgi:N-acetyl-gamma-glutamyl-phosphate reductase
LDRLPIAIVGASGYTGAELLRLLLLHPRIEIASISAGRAAGNRIGDVFPQFRDRLDMVIEAFDAAKLKSQAELVFTALPHAQSAPVVAQLREQGLQVVDLSADFRLHEQEVYDAWYGSEEQPAHPCADYLNTAVYGLPELHRDSIAKADLVAAPGCYPTGAILAAAPFLKAGLISAKGLIVDSKSGVSGAGRNPSPGAHFPEVGEGIRAYKVAGTHRHTPEMEQELSAIASADVRLTFTPHLAPMTRGILSCVYGMATDDSLPAAAYQDALESFYRDEEFVTVLPDDALPDTAHVRASNRVHVAVRYDARAQRVVMISAIDNLTKGSSGQAIQCMNLMRGWSETLGLDAVGSFP